MAVDRKGLFQDRDFQVLNEYRALLGGLFQRLYSLSEAQLDQVFPDGKARNLNLL